MRQVLLGALQAQEEALLGGSTAGDGEVVGQDRDNPKELLP
jgi:hypothetical protein